MPNLLKSGLAWLTQTLIANASEPVVYRRGADEVEVDAVFGAKLMKISDAAGWLRVEWSDMDFCIAAASLVVCGDVVTPAEDDEVTITLDDGSRETYRVYRFEQEPAWRWADPHRSMVRIHTKQVGTDTLC